MEAVYASLRAELGVFERGIRRYQESYWRGLAGVRVGRRAGGRGKGAVGGCPLSFLDALRQDKEKFDQAVVIPLCETLYVSEDVETPGSPSPSSLSLSSSASCREEREEGEGEESQGAAVGSWSEPIAGVAKRLFRVRRGWALLLAGGTAPPTGPLRSPHLVTDILEESQRAAGLARRWIHLHERRYGPGGNPPPPGEPGAAGHGRGVGMGGRGSEGNACCGARHRRDGQGNAQGGRGPMGEETRTRATPGLPAGHRHGAELELLVGRAERAGALERELRQCFRRSRQLRAELGRWGENPAGGGGARLRWGGEQGSGAGADLQSQGERPEESQGESQGELERWLRYEEFRYRILRDDWLLELQVRPLLIRRINTLQLQEEWEEYEAISCEPTTHSVPG